MSAAAFRGLLEAGDVDKLVDAWGQMFPGMPRPETREQAEMVMHHARTQTQSLALRHRAWSHRWLTERGMPSGLPDQLRPSAERMYPRQVLAVGISVNTRSEYLRPAAQEVQRAMEVAVEEAYADGRTDPNFVQARMDEARQRTWRSLLG